MVVLITSANKGIGFQIARTFGKNNEKQVIITSRNLDNGNKALSELTVEFPNTEFHLILLDLAEESTMKNALEFVKSNFGEIDVLINNAGYAYAGDNFFRTFVAFKSFPDENVISDYEIAKTTLAVNFNATRLFTELMEPFVRKRIITNSSVTSSVSFTECREDVKETIRSELKTQNDLVKLANDYLELCKTGNQAVKYHESIYGISKMLNRAVVNIHGKQYPSKFVASACPGWCATDLGGDNDHVPRTAEQGAAIFYWLSTVEDGDVLSRSGEFFREELGVNAHSIWDAELKASECASNT